MRLPGRGALAAALPAPELVAFAAGFALFALMAAPGVEWRDAGELTAGAWTLGGAHPPGQPAHALLGKLAALLPIGEIAFRVTLLSAAAMAATLAGVVALGRALVPGETVAAAAGAALLALSPVVQENATRAEVYAPAAALLVWAAVATVRFVRAAPADRDGRLVLLAGLAAALAAAFHPLIAAAGALPLAVALARTCGKRLPRLLGPLVALGLLGLACYAYLPLRAVAAHPPGLMWGDPSTPGAWLDVVAGAPYRGNFGLAGAGGRFAGLAMLCGEGSGLPLLLIGLVGLALGALTGLRGAGALLGGVVAVLLGAATQARINPDMPGYVLPALCLLAAGLTPAIGAALRTLPPAIGGAGAPRRSLVAAALLVPVVALGLAGPTARAEDGGFHRGDPALRLWADTVGRMPSGPALYLADGDDTLFPAWYEQLVAGARPDVAIGNPELCRDGWFMRALDRGLPELYVPFADDGLRGNDLAERMVVRNLQEGRPVGGDDWRLRVPIHAVPLGRGYLYEPPGVDSAGAAGGIGDAALAAPPPPDFGRGTGARVAGHVAMTRALYEVASGRLAAAARAGGVVDRFTGDELATLAAARLGDAHPPLLGFLPRPTRYFVFVPWLRDLLADELAWVAGLPDRPAVGELPWERRLHRLWRRMLRGEVAADGGAELAGFGRDAELATTTVYAISGRFDAAESLLRALIVRGDDAELELRLGRVLERLGRTGEAQAAYGRARELGAASPDQ